MKRILPIVLVSAFFAGCSTSSPPQQLAPSQANKQEIKDSYFTKNIPESAHLIAIDVTLLRIKSESSESYGIKWGKIFEPQIESKNKATQSFILKNPSNNSQLIFDALGSKTNSSIIMQTGLRTFEGESVGSAFTTSIAYVGSINTSLVGGNPTQTMDVESVEVGEKISLTPAIVDKQKIKIKLDGSISYVEDVLKLDNGAQFPVVHGCKISIQSLPLITSGESLLYPLCMLANNKYYIFISPRIEK